MFQKGLFVDEVVLWKKVDTNRSFLLSQGEVKTAETVNGSGFVYTEAYDDKTGLNDTLIVSFQLLQRSVL